MSSSVYPPSQNFPSDTSATEFSSKKMREIFASYDVVGRSDFIFTGRTNLFSFLACHKNI